MPILSGTYIEVVSGGPGKTFNIFTCNIYYEKQHKEEGIRQVQFCQNIYPDSNGCNIIPS